MDRKTAYQLLGLSSDASITEIKDAYRKLAIKFHPDVNGGSDFYSNHFRQIKNAYDILTRSYEEPIRSEKSKESEIYIRVTAPDMGVRRGEKSVITIRINREVESVRVLQSQGCSSRVIGIDFHGIYSIVTLLANVEHSSVIVLGPFDFYLKSGKRFLSNAYRVSTVEGVESKTAGSNTGDSFVRMALVFLFIAFVVVFYVAYPNFNLRGNRHSGAATHQGGYRSLSEPGKQGGSLVRSNSGEIDEGVDYYEFIYSDDKVPTQQGSSTSGDNPPSDGGMNLGSRPVQSPSAAPSPISRYPTGSYSITKPVESSGGLREEWVSLADGASPYSYIYGNGLYDNESFCSIEFDNGTSTDAVVFLVRHFDEKIVRNEYINSRSKFKMTSVPPGTYFMRVYYGNNWNSSGYQLSGTIRGKFSLNEHYSESRLYKDLILVEQTETPSEVFYSTHSITLHTTVGGNMNSEAIRAEDFFH